MLRHHFGGSTRFDIEAKALSCLISVNRSALQVLSVAIGLSVDFSCRGLTLKMKPCVRRVNGMLHRSHVSTAVIRYC